MKYLENMAEDLKYSVQQENPDINIQFFETIFNQTLSEIGNHVLAIKNKTLQESGFGPPKTKHEIHALTSSDIERASNYNITYVVAFVNEHEPILLP